MVICPLSVVPYIKDWEELDPISAKKNGWQNLPKEYCYPASGLSIRRQGIREPIKCKEYKNWHACNYPV